MLVTMFMALLWRRVPRVAYAVIALSVVSVSWNLWQIQKFVRFPEYTMKNAAERILRTIDEHPESRRLIMGHGANQTSLFIGVPSIDDTEGAWSVAQRLAKYQPGWILMWNDEKLSELAAVTSKRNLKLLLNVPALDGKGRNHLTLFQIAALDSKF
jgi:hypothetical protein